MRSIVSVGAVTFVLAGCGAADQADEFAQTSLAVGTGPVTATSVVLSNWSTGYCAEVRVRNQDPSRTARTWSVGLDLGTSVVTSSWNGTWQGKTGAVTVGPTASNSTLAPGQQIAFGFCANKGTPYQPFSITSVTSDLSSTTCTDGPVSVPTGRIELRVSDVDDYAFLSVNGLPRQRYKLGDAQQGQRIDVTSWFAGGDNTLRMQIVNTVVSANFHLELWVDKQLVLDERCPADTCGSSSLHTGLVYDKTFTVRAPFLPPAQTVELTSPSPGKVYFNDVFTGLTTPAKLSLPAGQHTLALGLSNDDLTLPTGSYRERTVTVGRCAQKIDLSTAPSPAPSTWKVLVLPVRNTFYSGEQAVLKDSDVPRAVDQVKKTSTQWFEPFGYGLLKWDVSAHPIVESTPVFANDPGSAADVDTFLKNAGLQDLERQYDSVVFLLSVYRADGGHVTRGPCCAWGGGRRVWFYNSLSDNPNEVLLHEVLHSLESDGQWSGLDGAHGSDEHGYAESSTSGFRHFYRDFIRGQVGETSAMRMNVPFPSIPATPALWSGIFRKVRNPRTTTTSGALSATTLPAPKSCHSVP